MLRVIYRTPVPPGISELFPWSRSVLTDRRGQRDRRTDGRTTYHSIQRSAEHRAVKIELTMYDLHAEVCLRCFVLNCRISVKLLFHFP